jgi:hypothetical protein
MPGNNNAATIAEIRAAAPDPRGVLASEESSVLDAEHAI